MREQLKQMGFRDVSLLLHSGIYVLVHRGEVIYVGQSTVPFSRIGHHNKYIRYDSVFFIRCPPDELNSLEKLMIRKLKPVANGHQGLAIGPKWAGRNGESWQDPKDVEKRWLGEGVVDASPTVTIRGMKFQFHMKRVR